MKSCGYLSFLVSSLLLLFVASGCGGGGGASVSGNNSGGTGISSGLSDSGASRTGEVQLTIQWPGGGPNGKLIPASTETIEARIQGDGLPNPMIQTASKSQTTLVFSQVPVGNKTVEVKALDAAKKIVAHRIIPIVVAIGQTASVPAQLGMTATDFGFVPSSMTLSKGETILVTNAGQLHHSVVNASSGSSITPDLAPGQSFSYQLQSPGTYNFRCGVHPSETGIMTVQFPPPEISGASPGSGIAGTTLTIVGNNFGTDPTRGMVTIGGVPVTTFPSWTDTRIDCTVPYGTGVTDGLVAVKINGVQATGSAQTFTVFPQMAWERTQNGSWNSDDEANDIVADSSGNVYVTGALKESSTWENIWTKKYDPNGTTLWEKKQNGYDVPYYDTGQGIALSPSGNVFVAGQVTDTSPSPGSYNLWVGGYNPSDGTDASGWPKWGSTGTMDRGNAVAVDSTGNVLVAGYIYDSLYLCNNFWVGKFNSSGGVVWAIGYDLSGANLEDTADDIAVDSSGNVYVTGSVDSGVPSGWDIWVRKYDANGNVLWARTHDLTGIYYDQAGGLCVDSSGNVYVTGFVGGPSGGDIWVRKYDTNGNELWTSTYNSPANTDDMGSGIAVDTFGNVYVTGFESRTDLSQGDNIWIRKYSPNGTPLWTETYNGPANGQDRGNGIYVDVSGNVYVAGSSVQGGTLKDIWVRKYRQ